MEDFFQPQFLYTNSADFAGKMAFNHNILRNEFQKHDNIIIPALKEHLSGSELADLLIQYSSPQEIDKIVLMIQRARKQNSDTKAIIELIASTLIMNSLIIIKENF